MQSSSQFLLALGGIFLLGLLASTIGHRTFLPRVTLLLVFGIAIGKEGLDILPSIVSDQFEIIADMTLLMVGFLLGGKLSTNSMKRSAKIVMWVSISAAVGTAIIVFLGLLVAGVAKEIAILLGCIASATAPAAILDVAEESGCKAPFKDLLLSIVALDDAWSLILFGFGIAVVTSINGIAIESSPLFMIVKHIGGAVILGILIGLPAAYLTGRIKEGQPILTEALGLVFICGGLAIWLDVSYLLASMVMGAVVVNLARHHEYPFHAIEGVEDTFMVVFFILAGASLEFKAINEIGFIGIVYILCRVTGKILGARVGSQCSKADQITKRWMGVALLPQAGVAIGMALVASNHFPEYRQLLLTVVISSTVFFEIVGPVFTRLALGRAGKV